MVTPQLLQHLIYKRTQDYIKSDKIASFTAYGLFYIQNQWPFSLQNIRRLNVDLAKLTKLSRIIALWKGVLRVTRDECVRFIAPKPKAAENDIVAARRRGDRDSVEFVETRLSGTCHGGDRDASWTSAPWRRRKPTSLFCKSRRRVTTSQSSSSSLSSLRDTSRMTTRPDECVQVFRGWNRNGPSFQRCGCIIRAFCSARRRCQL